MPRLPYADPETASPRVAAALEALPPLNIFRMMANAESAFVPWLRWGGSLLADLELDPLLRELAILRVSRLTPHAEYEWVQHVPLAEAAGATPEQIEALGRDETGADAFDEAQRDALAFTTEVVRDARASDATLERLRAHLSPREVVELLMVIGNYMLVARVMATTGIEMDEPAGPEALRGSS